MAELVAEAFLSVVFEQLFERFASPEFRKHSTGYQLKQLDAKLKNARPLLDDAEDRQLSDPDVKEWLDDLKHVVFQAGDLSEEIDNKKYGKSGIKETVTGFLKSLHHSLVGTVRREIGSISTDLDILLDRATVLGLKHGDSTARERGLSPRITVPWREEHDVFGRNGDRDKILELLLSDEASGGHHIGVVPIVGMGGLGKTTVARLVYDDTRVKELEFKLRAWVTVSTEFDVFKILTSILKQVDPKVSVSEGEEPTELQRKMNDALRGKKFLFVLDDVWDESYDNWDLLMSNFSSGTSGSRVMVTARSGKVGSTVKTGPIYELQKVSTDDCWSIFVHHAFSGGDSNIDPQLHEIGRRIVKKCNGLPLAVKAIGGLLRSERNLKKWENVLESHVWEWSENKQGNGVLPSLWLSYRYLSSPLKQCFAYCSIFPQDYQFRKEELVLLWMAEGFLPTDEKEKRSMEEIGEQYFDDLVSRSLFQRSGDKRSLFVMHDLVHDLAAFVSGESCFCVATEDVNLKRVTARTRHLSHINVSLESKQWTVVSKAKHLHSFLTLNEDEDILSEFVGKFITKQRHLRVLSIVQSESISVSFYNLKHLRYLKLFSREIKEVPNSICTLVNLQTLLLCNCFSLTQLPMDITKLIQLRHLDITDTDLTNMPPKMGNLKELRKLTNFVLGDLDEGVYSSIKEIQNLQHLSGKLHISGLQNVARLDDVGKDVLKHKANLKNLILEWNITDVATTRRESKDALEVLRPHTDLEKLVIRNYPASSFPIWVGDVSFSKIVSVELRGDFCDTLPSLGQLPSLVKLEIRGFHGVEKIGPEFYGDNASVIPFQRLETLAFHYMKSLKEWFIVDNAFCCLKSLKLIGCLDLPVSSVDLKTLQELEIWENSMECFPLHKFPVLKKLCLITCPNLKTLTSDGASESLTSMQLYRCPEMESFPQVGLPRTLEKLWIEYCGKLMARQSHWDLQKLPSLSLLSISGDEVDSALDVFPQAMLPSSLRILWLGSLRGLKSLNGSAFQQTKSLEGLYIHHCKELESLPEKELPTSLSTLEIYACPLLEKNNTGACTTFLISK